MFVYGFVCFFVLIIMKQPEKSFPESFINIKLDLAEIFRILKICVKTVTQEGREGGEQYTTANIGFRT